MVIPRITKEDLARWLQETDTGLVATRPRPVVVDVRLKYPYEHSTISLPGAIRQAAADFDPATLPRDREIILYDSDPEELVAESAAARLIRLGFRALVLQGGIAAWASAKLPTARKSAPQLAVPVSGLARG
jgi:rhodanese-related sulfurtransferase